MLNIFILNWNSAEDVSSLLNSLSDSEYKQYRVLLIHNGTSDELTMRELYSKYIGCIEIHLIINESNLGYAAGNNSGYEYIQKNNLAGDILIMNPDVLVQSGTLNALVDAKNKTNAGAIMIRTYDEFGVHLYDRVELNGFKQSYGISSDEMCNTDYAAGSCFLLDRGLIDGIGLFDPNYFMYWEEVDLSMRIKLQGRSIISVTNSYIVRKSNSIERSPNAIYYSARNSIYFYCKYRNNFNLFDLLNYLMKLVAYSLVLSIKTKSFLPFKACIKGILNGV